MQLAENTLAAVDAAIEAAQESTPRKHLGASVIGRPCARQIWYMFRWAVQERHPARVLRIFDRGQREEERFVGWLRAAGCTVWDTDENGEQFRVFGHNGHFGGSLDGVVKGVPDLDSDLPCLAEFKTHKASSFAALQKGVEQSKPEHYAQMQIYMHKAGLRYALYMAINKDTDALHIELIQHDTAAAEQYIDRARFIILSAHAPTRISKLPSWWQCKFCSALQVCHYKAAPAVNCRTCRHAHPVADAQWRCRKLVNIIPADTMYIGCDKHQFIESLGA